MSFYVLYPIGSAAIIICSDGQTRGESELGSEDAAGNTAWSAALAAADGRDDCLDYEDMPQCVQEYFEAHEWDSETEVAVVHVEV